MKNVFYYNRFLGEVVHVSEWKYDTKTKLVHYRLVGIDEWETDLCPVDEPMFCESKTQCMDIAKDIISQEMVAYETIQTNGVNTLLKVIDTVYDTLDIISWQKVRDALGADKCKVLAQTLLTDNA